MAIASNTTASECLYGNYSSLVTFCNLNYRFSFLMIKRLKDLESVTVIGTRKFFNQLVILLWRGRMSVLITFWFFTNLIGKIFPVEGITNIIF